MEERDENLWRIAKKRAGFKKQLATYIIINGFLWALWWFTAGREELNYGGAPWPIWSTLGWGIGLAFSYYNAYHSDSLTDTMKEYQKLKDRDSNKG